MNGNNPMDRASVVARVAAAAIVATVFLPGVSAWADDPQGDVTAATRTDIDLAGQTIMRIREGAGGYTAQQRAEIVRTRLIPILANPNLRASDVEVREVSKEPAIFVGGQHLITIDRNLAAYNRTTPEGLAYTWANNLRQVLPLAVAKGPASSRYNNF